MQTPVNEPYAAHVRVHLEVDTVDNLMLHSTVDEHQDNEDQKFVDTDPDNSVTVTADNLL